MRGKHLRLLRLLPSPPRIAKIRLYRSLRIKPQKPQKAHTGPCSVRLTIRPPPAERELLRAAA